MKNFIDLNGVLWALEDDGSQDFLIEENDLIEATEDQVQAIVSPPMSAEQKNDLIKDQIASIELNRQPRALREFVLGTDTHSLATINDEIAALRAQLTN